MAPRIPGYVLVLSGILTGVAAIALVSYYSGGSSAPADASARSNNDSRRATRLRRSAHVRRRRLRSNARHTIPRLTTTENDQPPWSDSEDDALSLLKDWSEDDNKNLLNMVYAISESQARKEGFVHRGITCNKCGLSPLRGIRYKCANCVDFDLCEVCEAANSHISTHVFLKIRIPIPPLANPRNALLPAFYPGKNNSKWRLTADKVRELQAKSHFDQIELEALYEQFKALSTVDKSEPEKSGIDKDTFEQCLGPLGLEKNLVTERIFCFFDQDRDGVINFSELVSGLSVLCKGNLDEKIEYAFKGYDLDGDGYISRDELYRMFKSYFYLSMELVRDVVSAMEYEMMDNFEFSASQPVSAAFNVTIPSAISSSGDTSSSSSDEEEEEEQTASGEAGPSSSSGRRRRYPLKEDYFEKQYAKEAEEAAAAAEDGSMLDADQAQALADPQLYPDLSDYDYSKKKNKQRSVGSKRPESPKRPWEEKFPIMESMSQDAINEMVDKTFKHIQTEREGYISLEEFRQCVQTDSSIVSWFEALGTVF